MSETSDPRNDAFVSRYGPWALVTGASSGIGEQLARQLAARGMQLLLVARRGERLERLASELRASARVEVDVLPLDLASPDFLEHLLLSCEGRDVGLVVSNAGVGAKGLHQQVPLEQLLVQAPDPLLHLAARKPRKSARRDG